MNEQSRFGQDEILTTKEIADKLKLGEQHVRTLCKTGRIKSYMEGRKGGYRAWESDVVIYLEKRFQERQN